MVSVEQLCSVACDDDKDTVAVQLDLGDSGLTYTPGDALGIYPSNDPEVRHLLGHQPNWLDRYNDVSILSHIDTVVCCVR